MHATDRLVRGGTSRSDSRRDLTRLQSSGVPQLPVSLAPGPARRTADGWAGSRDCWLPSRSCFSRHTWPAGTRCGEPPHKDTPTRSSIRGNSYAYGRGVAQDDTAAITWYRKAAEQGHASAQFNLGLMYAHGPGVAHDDAEAHMWFNLASSRFVGDDRESALKWRTRESRRRRGFAKLTTHFVMLWASYAPTIFNTSRSKVLAVSNPGSTQPDMR